MQNVCNCSRQVFIMRCIKMGIQEKKVSTCVILSIVTLGIYALIWMISLHEDTNKLKNITDGPSGGMVVLLTIVTCGIYGIYWIYNRGVIIDDYIASTGAAKPNNAVIYIVLSVVGLSIVAFALMQIELNKAATGGSAQ